jgi:hypothetical protein
MIFDWKHLMTPTVIVVLTVAATTTVFLTCPGNLLLLTASAQTLTGFTEQVSPSTQANATEPSVAVDRADGTIYVAWQGSGSHVARSDDGGRTFVQTPIADFFGRDLGDVAIRVGGPTPCAVPTTNCLPGTHRVYLTSLERLPALLQTRLAFTDDRGAHWTINDLAAINPALVDRPWLAVSPSSITNANQDSVYIAYHNFIDSEIYVASSHMGGQTGTFTTTIASLGHVVSPSFVVTDPVTGIPFADSFCNTVPSGIEVDPETGQVYVQWITADPVANTTEGCNITQIQNFHTVWTSRSDDRGVTWQANRVYDGARSENTDDIFATLAVDDSGVPGNSGNVYSVFADNKLALQQFDIWFSHSNDNGATWAPPVRVNGDKGTHFFPWIAAGSTGRVDFIWLNTPDFTPSDAALSPWSVTFAQTTNGNSATPTFNQTSASSSVMHVGGICTNGIFCSLNGGNRDLADSISIAIDRGGSAALVWTNQGRVLHGPTNITYGCVKAQQSAIVGANSGLSCKGPAGP